MKKILGGSLIIMILFTLASCYTHRHPHGHLPPGQVKKAYGEKSAKRHAPGQQKKKNKKHHKGYAAYPYQ